MCLGLPCVTHCAAGDQIQDLVHGEGLLVAQRIVDAD